MSKDLVVVILALAFAGASAALLVMLAKLQEEKERRWDEISRAVDLENIIEDRTKDVLFLNKEAQQYKAVTLTSISSRKRTENMRNIWNAMLRLIWNGFPRNLQRWWSDAEIH